MNKRIISFLAFFLVLMFLFGHSIFFANAENPNDGFWISKEPMPTPRTAFGVAVIASKIYAVGGAYTDIVEEYDPNTNKWTTKEPLPILMGAFATVACQGKLYVIDNRHNFVYDPTADAWGSKTPMFSNRQNFVANSVDGKIYVMAGQTFEHPSFPSFSNLTEVYDPETDSWTFKASMPDYEGLSNWLPEHLASAVSGSKIYIFLGNTEGNTTRIYDTETDRWSFGPDVPAVLRGPAAGATTGVFSPKRIHVLSKETHYVYDPEHQSWSSASSMPTSRMWMQIAIINDSLYAIGGVVGDYGNFVPTKVTEQYFPDGYIPEFPEWVLIPSLALISLIAFLFNKKRTKI